jgi:3-deoxy-manno-octulosonate cytidylyltransferase (CMP-KDO synthetase)
MKVLEKFVTLDQSRLEVTERLEQLRLLENNIAIHIVMTDYHTCSVDRPGDIETVGKIISGKTRIKGQIK